MSAPADPRFANRYVLEGELGRGGMGRVLLALDTERDHRAVALKLLRVDNPSPENIDALAREFEILTHLRHPNLVEVYDYAVQPECFFSMEYVEGRDLRATLLTDDELAEVMVQICRALEYIHSRGLVHLDIKPSNALVARHPDGLAVKLMDFGVSTFSHNRNLRGYTVGYVAPEVLEGRDFDGRADLFALGMTVGLVRRETHIDDDETATAPVSTTGDGLGRSALPPRNYELLPTRLRPIIERLVRREPGERYASAAQVIEAIGLALGAAIPTETAATRAGYLAARRLSGRARQWAQLAAAWTRALSEHAAAVRVIGPSGVGKSRLVNELRLGAQLRGALVVETRAVPDEGQSYGVVRRWVQALHPLCRGQLDPEVERELERFGNASQRRGPSEWTTAALGGRLIDAVLTVVELAAHKKELVLLVEDEQWVDAASRSVIARLRRAIAERPMGRLLLVCTERRDDAVAETLDEEPIVLGPLDDAESRALVLALLEPATLPDDVLATMTAAAQGSSLYLCELLRWLADQDVLQRSGDGWTLDGARFATLALPLGPEALIAARIAALPQGLRELLGAAAMLGELFVPSVLDELQPGGQVRVALLELTARNFLVAEGRRLRFGHALVRQAAIAAHEIRAGAPGINRQLADALAEHAGHPAEIARLLLASDRPARALGPLRAAVHRARALFDYHAATPLLAAARELCRLHGDDVDDRLPLEAELTIEWLEALRRAGRPDPVDKQALLAIPACRAMPGGPFEGPIRLELAELLLSRGAYDESAQEAAAALTFLGPGQETLAALAYRTLGLGRYHQGRLREAIDELDRAVQIAEQSGDELALSGALNDRGFVYGYTGDYKRAVEDHTLALTAQQRLADSEEVRFARAATENNLGFACWSLGRYELARVHLDEALRLRRQIRDRLGEATTLNNLGNVARHVGQLESAAQIYETAITLCRATGNALYEAIAQNNLGQVRDERGEHDQAETLYRAALQTVRRLGDRIREGDNLGSLGACLLWRGEVQAAREVLEAAITIRRAIGDRAYLTIDLSFLAVALAEEQRGDEARAALADCTALLGEVGEGIEQVQLVHLNRALAQRALGDSAAAARSLAQAREVIDRLAAALTGAERDSFLAQRIPRRILGETA